MELLIFLFSFCLVLNGVAQNVVIPLLGGMYAGEYWISVSMGTPASSSLTMQLDTGSANFVFPSSSCSTCLAKLSFNELKSTTYTSIPCSSSLCGSNTCTSACGNSSAPSVAPVCDSVTNQCCSINTPSGCGIYLAYGGGSVLTGALSVDNVTLTDVNNNIINFETFFGLIQEESGQWGRKVSGIIGLAYENLSCRPTCTPTFFETFRNTSSVSIPNIFSLCMTNTGGYFVMGENDLSFATTTILYVELTKSMTPSLYSLDVMDIMVGDVSLHSLQSLQMSLGKMPDVLITAVIDSGTTMLLLPSLYFHTVINLLQTNFPNLPGMQTITTQSCLRSPPTGWPDITIVFRGVTLTLSSSLYFFPLQATPTSKVVDYCFGIGQLPSSLESNNFSIFGDVFLRGFYTVFDLDNYLVGFSPLNVASCMQGSSSPKDQTVAGAMTSNNISNDNSSYSEQGPPDWLNVGGNEPTPPPVIVYNNNNETNESVISARNTAVMFIFFALVSFFVIRW